jgi:hypothetical protein
MRVLAGTNLFFFFTRRLPLPSELEKVLADEHTERFLSAVSVLKISASGRSANCRIIQTLGWT